MGFILEINKNSSVPIYKQLVDIIAEAIRSGDLKKGERILPIRQISKHLEINPGTVARAFQELEREGFLVSGGSTGSFVSETPLLFENEKSNWKKEFVNSVHKAKLQGISSSELIQLTLDIYNK